MTSILYYVFALWLVIFVIPPPSLATSPTSPASIFATLLTKPLPPGLIAPNETNTVAATNVCLGKNPSTKAQLISLGVQIQYFFVKSNKKQVQLTTKNMHLIDSTKPVKILVHGWAQDVDCEVYEWLSDAYLNLDVNIILVRWNQYAKYDNYIESAFYIPAVGMVLGQFITTLTTNYKVPLCNIHLLGFSMGAHVVGFAGKEVQALNNGKKVERISGLDPAGPCFGYPIFKPSSQRLSKNDAVFVDITHSDAGIIGIAQPIGQVDFRANGGTRVQPDCPPGAKTVLEGFCNHLRAALLYAASVTSKSMVAQSPDGTSIIYGEFTSPHATGDLYFNSTISTPNGE